MVIFMPVNFPILCTHKFLLMVCCCDYDTVFRCPGISDMKWVLLVACFTRPLLSRNKYLVFGKLEIVKKLYMEAMP